MIHAMTIDLEDYHSVVARDWLQREIAPTPVVIENTHRLLAMLADHDVTATFFTLGDVAETYPELIREIASAGHELGVHGYHHRQVFKLTPAEFRNEVAGAKALIEDLTGRPVLGHRAPAFSITPETRWALDVLANVGFRYDSSIFPIAGRRYGWPGFPPDIHALSLPEGGCIIEAPMSAVSLLGRPTPVCGGGYLRHFPGTFTHWAVRRIQKQRPVIVYLHPCEIETSCGSLDVTDLPTDAQKAARRFHRLQLRNRHTVESKLRRLMATFPFGPLNTVIDQAIGSHWRGESEQDAPATTSQDHD